MVIVRCGLGPLGIGLGPFVEPVVCEGEAETETQGNKEEGGLEAGLELSVEPAVEPNMESNKGWHAETILHKWIS